MALSIQFRMVYAMNLLVVGVGGVIGWFGVQVTGELTERRLVEQAADNTARLIQELPLPLSHDLLLRFRQILGSEVAVVTTEAISASLPAEQAREVAETLRAAGQLDRVVVGGRVYRVGIRALAKSRLRSADGLPAVLYLLAPESTLRRAKRAAAARILTVTLAAVIVATLLAIWLASTIASPVRDLAERMDALAREIASGRTPPALRPPGVRSASSPEGTSPAVSSLPATVSRPTELRRLENAYEQLLNQLMQARGELARSAQLVALGQLAATVAHELRNPLSGIKMNAKILADEFAAKQITDPSLELIIQEVERMDLFLGELLDLGRTQEGNHAGLDLGACQDVDLWDVANSVLALLRGRCRHAHVTTTVDVDADARLVHAAPEGIRQVVLNLALNALAALPEGGRMALVASRVEGSGIRFAVHDDGRGVQLAQDEDLFAPFVTTKDRSSGLGLYICRQIIERHHGQVGYDTGDSGSTFWFLLPFAPGRQGPVPPQT